MNKKDYPVIKKIKEFDLLYAEAIPCLKDNGVPEPFSLDVFKCEIYEGDMQTVTQSKKKK